MSLFNRKTILKSHSHSELPKHLREEPISLEDYYLNRQIIKEENERKTKIEQTKKELADYVHRHEQSRVHNLYYSRKERNKLTDKIGCFASMNSHPAQNVQIKPEYKPQKEDAIKPIQLTSSMDIDNKKAIDKLKALNNVLSTNRSDDIRFNELEYQSILAKESKPKQYEDYNKYLNDYVDSLIGRNQHYLQQVLGFKEKEMKQSVKIKDNNINSNNITELSSIPRKLNGRYDLGKSRLKDNPILLQEKSPLNKKMIENGKYILNNYLNSN